MACISAAIMAERDESETCDEDCNERGIDNSEEQLAMLYTDAARVQGKQKSLVVTSILLYSNRKVLSVDCGVCSCSG